MYIDKKNKLLCVFVCHKLCRRFKYLILHFAQMDNWQCHADLKCSCFSPVVEEKAVHCSSR